MEITEVKVFPVNEEKLKAFVSVVFDHCFMVNDIKVIQGREGLFISMPSRKKKSGEFKDVAHPLNNETRRMIEGEVLAEYERVLLERGMKLPDAGPRVIPERPAGRGAKEREAKRARPEPEKPARAAAPEAVEAIPEEPEPPVAADERPAPAAAGDEEREGAASPPAEAGAEGGEGERREGEKTLEEIEELHLRDSFWTVP